MSSNPQGTNARANMYLVDPSAIIVREGFNPRIDYGDIDDLALSIESQGVVNPIHVIRGADPTKFELVDGHRRFTAVSKLVQENRWTHPGVPAIIVDKATNETDQIVLMFVANEGKPFTPLEEADAFRRLVDKGLSVADIAKKVGHSDMYVRHSLDLVSAAPEVKEALKEGKLSKTTAHQIARTAKGDTSRQAALVAKATSGSKAEKKAAKAEVDPEQRKKRLTASAVRQQAAELTEKLREKMAEGGHTKKALREANADYDLILQIGMEKALADLVKLID